MWDIGRDALDAFEDVSAWSCEFSLDEPDMEPVVFLEEVDDVDE